MPYKPILIALFLLTGSCALAEETTDDQFPESWWPSEWGAEDQLGAANRLDETKVLEAKRLITRGQVYDLGRVFEDSMPLLSNATHARTFNLFSLGAPLYGPMGDNNLIWNEDFVSGHLTQDGTQFDSLSHMGVAIGDTWDKRKARYYNGFSHAEIDGAHGFKKLGTENVPPIFTRGILLDIEGLKDRRLEAGETITIADIKAALGRQGLSAKDIQSGDAVFVNTGWGAYWKVDNEAYNGGKPGLTMAAGDWLADREIVLLGTDNWGVDPTPGPVQGLIAPVHQKYMVKYGIYIIENMDFSSLLEDKVYRFAFSVSPIPLKGATGAPVRPMAIR